MPNKETAKIDWSDNKDVELVRLNMSCMSLAIQITEILKPAITIDTPFELAERIYEFITFGSSSDPKPEVFK